MAKSKGQILLAEMFGYVESLGGDGAKRGQLVPLDHHTSPLTTQEIQDIASQGVSDATDYEPDPYRTTRTAHEIGYCSKCGVQMRLGRRIKKHEAKCSGKVQG